MFRASITVTFVGAYILKRRSADSEWGRMQNYDMTLSSAVGIDKCIDLIAALAKK